MVFRAIIQHPPDLTRALQNFLGSNETEVSLTLRLYAPLEKQDISKSQDTNAHPLGVQLLEPLYHAWALALRDIQEPPSVEHGKIIFDLTRPPFKIMNLMHYESRGLARIAALLRHKLLRSDTSWQATIEGAPCWCVLRECEKHIAALPRAESWPVSRASHHVLEGTDPRGVSRCVDLAGEHWEDGHWIVLEGGSG